MSLLVVGSVALDTVYTPKGELVDGLGGSATYFSVASSLFTQVNMVGIVGTDFPQAHVDTLTKRGICVDGLHREDGKTFRWAGRYGEDFGDPETLDTQLNVFAQFSPELPEHFRNMPYLFLGNIHPALQLKVLDQMEKPKFTALDTMNFWIDRERDLLMEVFKRIDLAVINELEVRMLTGAKSVLSGARKIQEHGPRDLIVKRGVYGAMAFIGDDIFIIPAFPTDEVTDPTGAGDSFAGGMMGYIAKQGDHSFDTIKMAMVYGNIVASYNVEGFSITKLNSITEQDLEDRLATYRRYVNF